jgi:hypothetical protein
MMSKKVRRLVKAPVIQKIPRETEVRSDVLNAVRWFHWVERTQSLTQEPEIAKRKEYAKRLALLLRQTKHSPFAKL